MKACESVPNIATIGLPQATELSQLLANCVRSVFERKADRLEEKAAFHDPELFAEELDDLSKEDSVDSDIVYYVMKIVGVLLKGFK